MRVLGTFELSFFIRRKPKMKKGSSQFIPILMTFLLWISPGFAQDQPLSNCQAQNFDFCYSPCAYIRNKCNENRECSIEMCSRLYPVCHPRLNCPRFLLKCWNLISECTETLLHHDNRLSKRNLFKKDLAYLLLQLHPVVNHTSQFGFLTSGRFRRITGNFGTEFLGKRSNKQATGSRSSKARPTARPTTAPRFYSLPLNKFSQTKILKRDDDEARGFPGSETIVLGNGFLVKKGEGSSDWKARVGRIRRLIGSELLGKRNAEGIFDGSEFLGKRAGGLPFGGSEFLGKRSRDDSLGGSELLGKKSNLDSFSELLGKRLVGNELLGKRLRGNEIFGKKTREPGTRDQNGGMWSDYDPELFDEAVSGYRFLDDLNGGVKAEYSRLCHESNAGICSSLKTEESSKGDEEVIGE